MANVDWNSVFKAVGGGAVLLTAFAWLLKTVIMVLLKAYADSAIERQKSSFALDATSFEMQLKSKADFEIEHLKSALNIEHVRFSKLHEKRAEIIAELYKRLIDIQAEARTYILHRRGRSEDEMSEVKAMAVIQEFSTFLNQHRLYLPVALCELLDAFGSLVWEPVVHAWVYRDVDSTNPSEAEEKRQGFKKALEIFDNDIPRALRELETEFRKILGG